MVTVIFGGGQRGGWIRAILYDENGVEVDRVTGPTGMGDDDTMNPDQEFPVLLSARAPSLPGFYSWSVSWYGSPYDAGNPTVSPHVEETVFTNQFQVLSILCVDADGDGYEDAACNGDPAMGGGDCNDADASINPGAAEIPYNGIDDDCEPATPDDDLDGDGFGVAVDCDDSNPQVNPGMPELCGDGLDNDCDGLVDSDDPDCGADGIDGAVKKLKAPKRVKMEYGEVARRKIKVHVVAERSAGEAASGMLYLSKNGELVGSEPVTLSGHGKRRHAKRVFAVTITPNDAPECRWQATLELSGDPNPDNNSAVKTTRVELDEDDDDSDEDED